MKTAISIPNDIFAKAEGLRHRLGKSRSELYAEAVRQYLLSHDPESITERLNQLADVFEKEDLGFVNEAARRILQRTEWE